MAISGWAVFLIILLLLVVAGGGGYIFYVQYRAKKLGLPPPNLNPFNGRTSDGSYRPPAPAPGGIVGWISDKINALRNGRSAGGAYEGAGSGAPRGYNASRGFGALEPDEAWNARVDDDTGGYYEEQELGLQDPSHGPYGGGGYGDAGAGDMGAERGRSRSRDGRLNPFGDQAEQSSLRAVSPRPEASAAKAQRPSHARAQSNLSAEDSPTERRSMFHEDV